MQVPIKLSKRVHHSTLHRHKRLAAGHQVRNCFTSEQWNQQSWWMRERLQIKLTKNVGITSEAQMILKISPLQHELEIDRTTAHLLRDNSQVFPSDTIDLLIRQRVDWHSQLELGTGTLCWDCSFSLCSFLQHYLPRYTDGLHPDKCTKVIELGSGTGLVGIAVYHILNTQGSCQVVLTDLPAMIPLLRENVAANPSPHHVTNCCLTARALDWEDVRTIENLATEDTEPFDVIICSELLYAGWSEDPFHPLLQALTMLVSDHTLVIFAYEERAPGSGFDQGVQDFFRTLIGRGFLQIQSSRFADFKGNNERTRCFFLARNSSVLQRTQKAFGRDNGPN